MEAPRTPGRSGSSQATSAASPFHRIDSDSPKLRASTLAYGQPRMASQKTLDESHKEQLDQFPTPDPASTPVTDAVPECVLQPPMNPFTSPRAQKLDSSHSREPQLSPQNGHRFGYVLPHGSSSSTYLPEASTIGPNPEPRTPSRPEKVVWSGAELGGPGPIADHLTPRRSRPMEQMGATVAHTITPSHSATPPHLAHPTHSTHQAHSAHQAHPIHQVNHAQAVRRSGSSGSNHQTLTSPHTPVRSRSQGPISRQSSTPQRGPSSTNRSSSMHGRTYSGQFPPPPHFPQPSEAQTRRTPSHTYKHDTHVPGANDKPVEERRKPQKRTSIGPWDFIKSIGAGSMGQVKLAQHRYTRQLAAVKIVPKAFTQRSKDSRETNEAKDARVIREAAIGRLLYHPNIARLYDVYSMTGHFYLVFEFINGGQMLDYIIAHGCVKEPQARQFARSIASALDYCHHNSIVHRDLKIENILIADNGEIKLIDFGLSNLFRRDDLLRTFCGSLYFAAPELLNALPYVGPEIDVWSFGVVLYVLVCGKVPFEDKSMTLLHAKIKRGNVEYPQWLSSLCVDLLSRMLVVNPSERATMAEVMRHPWMNKGFEAYPDAQLPRRVPLTSNTLDFGVIEEMESLGIGDAGAIERSLRAVLNSSEYEKALERWYDRQLDMAEADPSSKHLLPSLLYSPDPDPLDSFSPEISCYFLTKERIDKARSPANSSTTVVNTGSATATGLPFPDERERRQASPTPQLQGRVRAKTLGAAYEGRPAPIISISPAGNAPAPEAMPAKSEEHDPMATPPPAPAYVSSIPQQAQLGLVTSTSAAKPINLDNRVASDSPGMTSMFRKLSLRRRPGSGHERARSTGHPDMGLRIQQNDSSQQSQTSMPSIESPKPVFFRGIFSVQTTSTRSLKEIRAEIIRVLEKKQIEYVEVRGGFACVARTDEVEVNRRPSQRANELAVPPSTPPRHRRMVSDNVVASPVPSLGGSSDSDIEIGGSDMLGDAKPASVPVRFEIDIVRVPIVSLHGVQFKKMTGNVWQYKNLAQEILEDLRL